MLLHPSDFAPGSESSFAHALKLALATPHELTLLHVVRKVEEQHPTEFHEVRAMLERWGVLEHGSSRVDVLKTGLRVEEVTMFYEDPPSSIDRFMKKHPPDFVVLSTHQRMGILRWLQEAVAEPVARRAAAPTLFVPDEVSGFVSAEDGSVSLKNILVPVDANPAPQPAVDAAEDMARVLGASGVSIRAVHVGKESELPTLGVSMRPESDVSVKTEVLTVKGEVVDEIVQAAHDWAADLIVMSTAGHHGFLDALRGSTTEQVLRRAPCPLLAVPQQPPALASNDT